MFEHFHYSTSTCKLVRLLFDYFHGSKPYPLACNDKAILMAFKASFGQIFLYSRKVDLITSMQFAPLPIHCTLSTSASDRDADCIK